MKKIIILHAIFISLLLGSCENAGIQEPIEQPDGVLQIIATVNDDTRTRALLTEGVNEVFEKVIRFQWETGDEIQLTFQQGGLKAKVNSVIHVISENNKSAIFNVTIPDGINKDEPFTLYAYHGAGTMSGTNPTTISLPQNLSGTTSGLEEQAGVISLWSKKEVLPESGVIPEISLLFNHLGAIMSLEIYNSGYKTAVFSDVKMSSENGTPWLYSESTAALFDMASGSFEQTGESPDMLIKAGNIAGGTSRTFYRWFVPGNYQTGNSLKISVLNAGSTVGTVDKEITPKTAFTNSNNYRLSLTLDSEVAPYPMEVVDNASLTPEVILFGTKLLDHPRLLFTRAEEEILLKNIPHDPLLADMVNLLREKADGLLGQPLLEFPSGTVDRNNDILNISRGHLYRIIKLALAYRIFNEAKYAEKAIDHILNACNYPTWNPAHFLDVAEMSTAIAIGYDWLYPLFTRSERSIIVNALKTKAINNALPHYNSTSNNWFNSTNNWNTVCNSGISLGVLAIAEEYDDATTPEFVINYATTNMPNNLNTFNPDGVAYEGPTYAQYTINYYSMLSKTLHDNFGIDRGLAGIPGVKSFGDFYVQTVSPTKRTFNFGDTSESGVLASLSPFYFFYSKIFDEYHLSTFYKELLKEVINGKMDFPSRTIFFLSIPWYDTRDASTPVAENPMKLFNNTINPIAVFNRYATSPNAVYLIAKGGKSSEAHQHLDMGSFIMENQGVRWLEDIGQENYDVPGFGDYSPGGTRWNYFRNSSFSHNVPMVDGQIQNAGGRAFFQKNVKTGPAPFVVFNLDECYVNQAGSVRRGIKHLNEDLILLQDEIQLTGIGQEATESFLTRASITLGSNIITLEQEGKIFYLKILEPANFTTEIIDATTFRIHALERPVDGYTALRITAETTRNNQKVAFKVLMSSDLNKINAITGTSQSLDEW